jgi:hypothetical protein
MFGGFFYDTFFLLEVKIMRYILFYSTVLILLLSSCTHLGKVNAPELPPSGPIRVKTPDSPEKKLGLVSGRLINKSTKTPLPSLKVYLGQFLPLHPGPNYLITFQEKSSPQTFTDTDGNFTFREVPPGIYPLMVWTPIRVYVVEANGKKELRIAVNPGEIINLNEVEIDLKSVPKP